jgi:hypothetical protein
MEKRLNDKYAENGELYQGRQSGGGWPKLSAQKRSTYRQLFVKDLGHDLPTISPSRRGERLDLLGGLADQRFAQRDDVVHDERHGRPEHKPQIVIGRARDSHLIPVSFWGARA